METDLASFLSPSGSTLGDVTQHVLEFLSVQDLIDYVAVRSSSSTTARFDGANYDQRDDDSLEDPRFHYPSSSSSSSDSGYLSGGNTPLRRRGSPERYRGGPRPDFRESRRRPCPSPEQELPRYYESSRGEGDEAGGASRAPTPYPSRAEPLQFEDRAERDEYDEEEGGYGFWDLDDDDFKVAASDQQQEVNVSVPAGEAFGGLSGGYGGGGGVEIVVVGGRHKDAELKDGLNKKEEDEKSDGADGPNLLGVLIGLGLRPWAALGVVRGGVARLLGGVPLLALLRWASGGASAIIGVSFRVALLPYDVTKGLVSYVVGSVQAMMNVATEIWRELRHLSLAEMAVVISCVVSGNALPKSLIQPAKETNASGSGSSCGGISGTSRVMSLSSSLGSGAEYSSEYSLGTDVVSGDEGSAGKGGKEGGRKRVRSKSSLSDDSRPGSTGSRMAWRLAHALRRKLDRVNRTASLVSYEERPERAVPRAKAQRVRRRMHYTMSLQCFQATVTMDDRHSPAISDPDPEDGSSVTSAGGASSTFMCTPQSFPPTPVSRAHVMARTSQFADDILFLARDQLRLGENLKDGVDETTRATADFLRRQQRLAVLDAHNACEGIVLTCGHHRASKVGSSMYSSVRAMVPVLRNRHVYFQVSCVREGSLPPMIGVGLSTPEMPLSTLVGAFSNSVGLCSTGQILMSSRWYGHSGDYAVRSTTMSTVGVLVYLDGNHSFRSWDGDMVRALVCFSVDGRLVHVSGGPPGVTAPGAPPVFGPSPLQAHPSQSPRSQPVPLQKLAANVVATGSLTPAEVANLKAPVGRDTQPAAVPWAPGDEVAPWEFAAAAAATAARAAAACGAASAAVAGSGEDGRKGGGEKGVAAAGGGPPTGAASGKRVQGKGPAKSGGGGVKGGRRFVGRPPAVITALPPRMSSTSAALGLALPKDRDLYPTVTLNSFKTEVLCRFCVEDLLQVSRESIGAPPGAPVYALDGSIIDLL